MSDAGLEHLALRDADAYLERVCALIQSARLNDQYPASHRLVAHLQAMTSSVTQDLYPGVAVERESGLPTYKDWARVRTDASLAAEVLSHIAPLEQLQARAAQEPEGVHARQLVKRRYYTALVERPLMPLDAMHVELRRVEPETRQAFFHIVFDKLDARGRFVRYTLDVAQQSSFWTRAMIQLSEDHAQHTQELRSMVYRYASLDAELMLVSLAAHPSISVERVIKSTLGPFFLREISQDDPLAGLLQGSEAAIGSFALDMAAVDVAQDADNDPIDDLMSASLSKEARADYEIARKSLGYHVFKDRKFVADRDSKRALEAYCQQAGTRNIIYPLRKRRRSRRREGTS